MFHSITSNRLTFRSVSEDVQNFMVVHHYDRPIYVSNIPQSKMIFDVYVPYDSGLTEEYQEYKTSDLNEYNFHEVQSLSEALDKIGSQILDVVVEEESDEDVDILEDLTVTVVSDENFSKLVTAYLNRFFNSSDVDVNTPVQVLNMIEYIGQTDFSSLVKQIQANLGLSMIYPDDPLAFAYASRLVFAGR